MPSRSDASASTASPSDRARFPRLASTYPIAARGVILRNITMLSSITKRAPSCPDHGAVLTTRFVGELMSAEPCPTARSVSRLPPRRSPAVSSWPRNQQDTERVQRRGADDLETTSRGKLEAFFEEPDGQVVLTSNPSQDTQEVERAAGPLPVTVLAVDGEALFGQGRCSGIAAGAEVEPT